MESTPRVLVLCDYYIPGYKGGGPIRTISNLVSALGRQLSFRIITRDRDAGDSAPYTSVSPGVWNQVGHAQVWYLKAGPASAFTIRRLVKQVRPQVLYLNSLFSVWFTILPLIMYRLTLIRVGAVVLAPRGELSAGALGLKQRKKRWFLRFAKWFGLYGGVLWQASSEHEECDIRKEFGDHIRILVAPDVLPPVCEHGLARRPKETGVLHVLFIGRISRMKNLLGALRMLAPLRGDVYFSIYGPVEDRDYWDECQREIRALPDNVQVRYGGVAAHSQVAALMAEHDLFLLPTLGENFGHVIYEALSAGCPVLISDRTPWRGLQDLGVGWDLPLTEPMRFSEILQQCVDMPSDMHRALSTQAQAYARTYARQNRILEANEHLFRLAVALAQASS